MICLFENKKDEQKRDQLMRENAQFKMDQVELENDILMQLRNSGEDILNDEKLINSLNDSKELTIEIKQKLQSSEAVEQRIEI